MSALRRGRAGTTAIELGLLLPAFLLIAFAIMDFGRCVWTHSSLQLAVQAAARCAAVETTTCGTSSQVQSYALSRMLAPGATAATFTYSASACGDLVSASMTFTFLVKIVHNGSITLTAQACYPT